MIFGFTLASICTLVLFDLYADKFDDLNNYQDVFLFHLCTNALERVSIRNMNYYYDFYDGDDDDHDIEIMIEQMMQAALTEDVM